MADLSAQASAVIGPVDTGYRYRRPSRVRRVAFRIVRILLYCLVGAGVNAFCTSRAQALEVGNNFIESGTRSLRDCFIGLEVVLPVEGENFAVWAYMGEEFDGRLTAAWLFDGPESYTKSSGMQFVEFGSGTMGWQQLTLTSGPPTMPPGTYVIGVIGEGGEFGDFDIASVENPGIGDGRTSADGCTEDAGAPDYTWSVTDTEFRPSIYLEYSEVLPDPPAVGGQGIEGWLLLLPVLVGVGWLFGSDV